LAASTSDDGAASDPVLGGPPPPRRPRTPRLSELPRELHWREFALRREGMIHAMDGGLWLHRHVWKGERMAHLVSTDRARLLAFGRAIDLPLERLQYKPLKDPRTGERREAWHWDLVRHVVPPIDD
jgi:hypothetical protein